MIKKFFQVIAIIAVFLAAYFNYESNTDRGRSIYKYLFCRDLSSGIDNLFQNPNKFRRPNAQQRHFAEWNFFYIENNEAEFKVMKEIICSNYYSKQIDYPIKAILQYQAAHHGNDALNTNFNFRPILFLKETDENKGHDIRVFKVSDIMRDSIPITTEVQLTRDIDNYLTNQIKLWAMYFVIIAALLNSICLFLKDKS